MEVEGPAPGRGMKREARNLSREILLEVKPRQSVVDLVREILEVGLTMRRILRESMAPVEIPTRGAVSPGVPKSIKDLGQENLTTKVERRTLDPLEVHQLHLIQGEALRQSRAGQDHAVRARHVGGQQRSTDQLW